MRINGGKGGAGVYQQIISLMPHHEVYIEAFLGAGNILRRKRPAPRSVAIEMDEQTMGAFKTEFGGGLEDVEYVRGDCIAWLLAREFSGHELVYCDPPYPFSCRRSGARLYRREYSDEDHLALLGCLRLLPCYVMISSYPNHLYDNALYDWWTHGFQAMTRGGRATEMLWMNFDPDAVPKHEYTHVGANYRERERIKRKTERWIGNLMTMPADERNAILAGIARMFPSEYGRHAPGCTGGDDDEDLIVERDGGAHQRHA